MSESTRAKRPDRQLYRPPKFSKPAESYDLVNADPARGDERWNQTPATSSDCPTRKVHSQNYRQSRGRGTYRGSRGRTGVRQHPDKTSSVSGNANKKVTPCDLSPNTAQAKVSDIFENTVDLSGGNPGSDNLSVSVAQNHSSGMNKHGGLIHLPKDIDIYQAPDEQKTTAFSRQTKRSCNQRKCIALYFFACLLCVTSHLFAYSHPSRHEYPPGDT